MWLAGFAGWQNSRAHVVHLEPYSTPPTIILLHQHTNYNMSSIEDPKQSSLRTGQTSHNALGINAPPSPAYKSTPADSSMHYTCFIRLPFLRGDFVDPPQVSKTWEICSFDRYWHEQVDWNSTKDRALWKIISKASNSKELDCMYCLMLTNEYIKLTFW